MLVEPGNQFFLATVPARHGSHKIDDGCFGRLNTVSNSPEEHVHSHEGRSLVAVLVWVISGKSNAVCRIEPS